MLLSSQYWQASKSTRSSMTFRAPQLYKTPIITLNCNSIKSRKKQLALEDYLSTHNPAIVLLQETRSTLFHPSIAQYNTFTSSLSQPLVPPQVGTSVLVKRELHATQVLLDIQAVGVESSFVEVHTEDGTALVGSVYLRCELAHTTLRRAVDALLAALSGYSRVVLGGDFNCNMRITGNQSKAEILRGAIVSHAHMHIVAPTEATHGKGGTLDFFIVRDPSGSLCRSTTNILPLFSDHHGVKLSLSFKYNFLFVKSTPRSQIKSADIDWPRFNSFVEKSISLTNRVPLLSTADIDKEIDRLTKDINLAIDTFLRSPFVSPICCTPANIKALLKERSVLIRAIGRQRKRVFPNVHVVNFLKEEHKEHMNAIRGVLRYLAGTANLGIRYERNGFDDLIGYVDADWAQCTIDRRSYTGYVTLLSAGPISWESKKQPTVALSSTEAEYMALTSAAKEIQFLRNILIELQWMRRIEDDSVKLYFDNLGAKKLAENNGYSPRTKHMYDVRHHYIRELLEAKAIRLYYVNTKENILQIYILKHWVSLYIIN